MAKFLGCDGPECSVMVGPLPDDDDRIEELIDGWVSARLGVYAHTTVKEEEGDHPLAALFGRQDSSGPESRGLFHTWDCFLRWAATQEAVLSAAAVVGKQ